MNMEEGSDWKLGMEGENGWLSHSQMQQYFYLPFMTDLSPHSFARRRWERQPRRRGGGGSRGTTNTKLNAKSAIIGGRKDIGGWERRRRRRKCPTRQSVFFTRGKICSFGFRHFFMAFTFLNGEGNQAGGVYGFAGEHGFGWGMHGLGMGFRGSAERFISRGSPSSVADAAAAANFGWRRAAGI
jgi:hypothetical protein